MTIITYVVVILAGIVGGVVSAAAAYNFMNRPSEELLLKFTEWLLYAVAEAEKELGGGTGQLKLRYVYNKAMATFPKVIKYISFEKFSELVDIALDKFKEMLKTNPKLQQYVGTEKKEN